MPSDAMCTNLQYLPGTCDVPDVRRGNLLDLPWTVHVPDMSGTGDLPNVPGAGNVRNVCLLPGADLPDMRYLPSGSADVPDLRLRHHQSTHLLASVAASPPHGVAVFRDCRWATRDRARWLSRPGHCARPAHRMAGWRTVLVGRAVTAPMGILGSRTTRTADSMSGTRFGASSQEAMADSERDAEGSHDARQTLVLAQTVWASLEWNGACGGRSMGRLCYRVPGRWCSGQRPVEGWRMHRLVSSPR
jgi:hypothetical protein